jgi:hypothetical protein
MDLNSFAQAVHESGVAEWMRGSLKAMPIVESIHVLCAALVFGTILIVDLRMLGYPNTKRSFTRIHHELIPLTWVAFVVSVITGALMFAPNSITYVGNTAFQLKLLAILAAGINMAIFQLVTARSVATWDQSTRAPSSVRLAGALSILLWITVIFLARGIGFTKGYDFTVPTDVQFDFSK